METLKSYIDEKQQAFIVCSQCGARRIVDASKMGSLSEIKAKCTCGFVFLVSFERRYFYRKKVNLRGEYLRPPPDKSWGEVLVVDISRTGLAFRRVSGSPLKTGETVKITFTLDDPAQSVISKNVIVRRVDGDKIGAEFVDRNLGKALGFYLMP